VLVDARNVLRSRWPNIPEQKLVDLCWSWAAANGCRAVVVFDGRAPGGIVDERVLGPHCVVVGSGTRSADSWIERAAAGCHASGKRYWIVTSDRALRDVAGHHAERRIGGGSFAGELCSLDAGDH
jgi:predicted RNA-binding protein with PIN domain